MHTRDGLDVYIDGNLKVQDATITEQFGIVQVMSRDRATKLRFTDARAVRNSSGAWAYRGTDSDGRRVRIAGLQRSKGCGACKKRST